MAAMPAEEKLAPTKPAEPFLKWVGGKRASAAAILDVFPERIRRYFEPMLGGGAVFFALRAAERITVSSILSDVNEELIGTFSVVKEEVESLILELSKLRYDRAEYEAWRKLDPWLLDGVQTAARMIYLNRTGFNGLYRVNRAGQFNVPFGRYTNPTICNAEGLRAASRALAGAHLECVSCFKLLDGSAPLVPLPMPGDAVYLDPPYVPLSKTANFTAYDPAKFTVKDQERLAELFDGLARRGVAVALSNSSAALVEELYYGHHIRRMNVRRNVNSKVTKRGPVGEVLITANCRGD
jgi:DNA adenine methylase